MEFDLTVIMPGYNVGQYVDRCMQSIINQTIGIERIFIIMINDASTDDTIDRMMYYGDLYPDNVLIINMDVNNGPGYARNIALEYVNTPYLTFIDADDWIEPAMYETMLKEAIESQVDVVMCDSVRSSEYELQDLSLDNIEREYYDFSIPLARREFLQQYRQNIVVWNKLYRSDFFLRKELLTPPGLMYEDNYTGMMIYLLANSIVYLDIPFYHWYRNQKSITSVNRQGLDRIIIHEELMNAAMKASCFGAVRDIIEFNYYDKIFIECSVPFIRNNEITDYIVEVVRYIKKLVERNWPNLLDNPFYLGKEKMQQSYLTPVFTILYEQPITKEVLAEFKEILESGIAHPERIDALVVIRKLLLHISSMRENEEKFSEYYEIIIEYLKTACKKAGVVPPLFLQLVSIILTSIENKTLTVDELEIALYEMEKGLFIE